MKRLIVNADDFGLTEGVNKGIISSFKKGIVTDASLIACGAAFPQAVALAKENPGLELGIHLTLIEEKPILRSEAIPSLLGRDHRFYSHYTQFLTRFFTRRIRLSEMEKEFRAQIEKHLTANLILTHIDSHQHIHILPGIFEIVLNLAQEYQIPFIRTPNQGWLSSTGWGLRNVKRFLLAHLARRAKKIMEREKMITLDNFCGFLSSGKLSVEIISLLLSHLPEGVTEMVCHPGVMDEELVKKYGHWGYHWQQELESLTNPRILELIKSLNISLIHHSDILNKGNRGVPSL